MFPSSRRKCNVLAVLVYFGLFAIILYLVHENSILKTKITTLASSDLAEIANIQALFPDSTNETHASKMPRKFRQPDLTIILFQESNSVNLFNNQMRDLKKRFPSSPLLWNKDKERLGKSISLMVSQVKTEYFLFLEPRVLLSDRSQESITLLWDALEQFSELDFVGGSYLSDDKLHVPCHRFRLCRWTFSESYEYKRSLDDIMICDGISSSFMGRTDSVKKVKGGFDANIPDLLVGKDFFLRAKASNVVVGTRPIVIFLYDKFKSLHQSWTSREITKELVPFAIKHKVFMFKDIEGNVIDLCSPTSPLSGKSLCIEQNSHKLMLNGGHWAYKGLFTYPYLLKYLEVTLSEISEFFNRRNVSYYVDGGVALGAIKMRSILPWEAGDIDMGVYGMTLDQLYNLLKPLIKEKGYVVRIHHDSHAVHVFCTPRNVGDVSGGLLSIFPQSKKTPLRSEFMKIKTSGTWVSYDRNLFRNLVKEYGKKYLEHKLYNSRETIECKIKDHNACLPNFKSLFRGKGGSLREYFCQI